MDGDQAPAPRPLRYRVEAEFTLSTVLAPDIPPLVEVWDFDATHREEQRVVDGGHAQEVRVQPMAGEIRETSRGDFREKATGRAGVTLRFGNDGSLESVSGFAAANQGAGAGLSPINIAPLHLLLKGMRVASVGSSGDQRECQYQHKVVLDDLGRFTLEVAENVKGTRIEGTRDCRAVQLTPMIPAGSILAEMFRVKLQGVVRKGAERVECVSLVDLQSGRLVRATGSFSAKVSIIPEGLPEQQQSCEGQFEVGLPPDTWVLQRWRR